MNFPVTSLIPTVLALSNFFMENFPNIFWYPYWYLGNPFYYLIGPVVPFLLFLINKVTFLPIQWVYSFSLIGSLFCGGAGVYCLVSKLNQNRKQALLASLIYIFLPFYPLLLLTGSGLHHISLSIIPWVFLLFISSIKYPSVRSNFILSLIIALLLLIEISSILPLLIGMVALFFSLGVDKRRVEYLAIKTLLVILLGFAIATFWYTSSFWIVLLSNPSFAGAPLLNVIKYLYQLLLNLLPIAAALVVVKLRHKKVPSAMLFGLLFTSSYLFLTLIRFISDPDFVIDWTSYLLEIQLGLAIILGIFLSRFLTNKIRKSLVISLFLVILSVSFLFIIQDWFNPQNQQYKQRVSQLIKNILQPETRIFISGSAVFWINSVLNINQVRGGNDNASVNPTWADGAFQIREGGDEEITKKWLRIFGTRFLIANDQNSKEPFHDFKAPNKFQKPDFIKIASQEGDNLYSLDNIQIARIANKDILGVNKPKNGIDQTALNSYLQTFHDELDFKYLQANKIYLSGNFQDSEVASLAVSYHPDWHLTGGQGVVAADKFGNLVVIPTSLGQQEFELEFKLGLEDELIPLALATILITIIYYFDRIFPRIQKGLLRLAIGLSDNE